jgi:small GTP-binding protein
MARTDSRAGTHVLVLVGLPASGKTTLSRALASLGWLHISADEHALGTCRSLVEAELSSPAPHHIVIDACSATRAQRAPWVALASQRVVLSCLHLTTPRLQCEKRAVARRDHRLVPVAATRVVAALAAALQEPAASEGFSCVLSARTPRAAARALRALDVDLYEGFGDGGGGAALVAPPPPPDGAVFRASLSRLEAWLRGTHPRDVLVPFFPGEKHPRMAYKGDAWGWPAYDALPIDAAGGGSDWAIALRDLCVVDVDAPPLAALLEEAHPALRAAPCARTRRGFHYYFLRPADADARGFFDGSGQRGAGVDFKSVTATGTSGLILVPPSLHKVWVRAPWDAAPVEMPAALLQAVARPRMPQPAAALLCAGGGGGGAYEAASDDGDTAAAADDDDGGDEGDDGDDVDSVSDSSEYYAAAAEAAIASAVPPPPSGAPTQGADGDHLQIVFSEGAGSTPLEASPPEGALDAHTFPAAALRAFEFCEAYVSGRWLGEARVPCDAATFHALLLLDTTNAPPLSLLTSPAQLARLGEKADLLGASVRDALAVPAPARVRFHFALRALDGAWWRAHADEERRAHAGASGDGALVRVDAALAAALRYEPAEKDGAWLFPSYARQCGARAGEPVLRADPAAQLLAPAGAPGALPPPLLGLLHAFPRCLVLAGGAVVGAVGRFVGEGSDWDVFLHSVDAAGAAEVFAAARAALGATHALSLSRGAATFTPRAGGRPIQFVRCLFRDRAQVLESFDLAPCKVLARAADDDGGGLVVETLPAWVGALRRMAFWVDPAVWGDASPARVIKYVKKGFDAALPGVVRGALDAVSAVRGHHEKPRRAGPLTRFAGVATLEALLAAEAAVEEGVVVPSLRETRDDWRRGHGPPNTLLRGRGGAKRCALTHEEADALVLVLSGGVARREYVRSGGYDQTFQKTYAFMGDAAAEAPSCNDPDAFLDEASATPAGPRFVARDAGLAALHSEARLAIYYGGCALPRGAALAAGGRLRGAPTALLRALFPRSLHRGVTPHAAAILYEVLGAVVEGVGAALRAARGAAGGPTGALTAPEVRAAVAAALPAPPAAGGSLRGLAAAAGAARHLPLPPIHDALAPQVAALGGDAALEDGAVAVLAGALEALAGDVLELAGSAALAADAACVRPGHLYNALARDGEYSALLGLARRPAGAAAAAGGLHAALFLARDPANEGALFGWAAEPPPPPPPPPPPRKAPAAPTAAVAALELPAFLLPSPSTASPFSAAAGAVWELRNAVASVCAVTVAAARVVATMGDDALRRVALGARARAQGEARALVSDDDVAASAGAVLVGELAKHGGEEGKRAVQKWGAAAPGGPASASARAGLHVSVAATHARMVELAPAAYSPAAAVFAAAVVEYVMEQVLAASFNAARDARSEIIGPRSVALAVGDDEELRAQFPGVIPYGGGVPCVPAFLVEGEGVGEPPAHGDILFGGFQCGDVAFAEALDAPAGPLSVAQLDDALDIAHEGGAAPLQGRRHCSPLKRCAGCAWAESLLAGEAQLRLASGHRAEPGGVEALLAANGGGEEGARGAAAAVAGTLAALLAARGGGGEGAQDAAAALFRPLAAASAAAAAGGGGGGGGAAAQPPAAAATAAEDGEGSAIKPTYKVVLLGDGGVGKTAALRALLTGDNEIEQRYLPTIGAEVRPCVMPGAQLNVWDTAGQERYAGLRDGYYILSHGAVIVADDRRSTVKSVMSWHRGFLRVCGPVLANVGPPVVLVITKGGEFPEGLAAWAEDNDVHVVFTDGEAESAVAESAAALKRAFTHITQTLLSNSDQCIRCSPLFRAAKFNDLPLLQQLLAHPPAGGIDSTAGAGFTALFIASLQGHAKAVRALLAAGAAVDGGREAPLHAAAVWGHEEVVGLLLAAGAAVNGARWGDGSTALLAASWSGHAAVMRALLAAGAAVGAADADGATPLHAAAQSGHVEAVQLLLAAGAPTGATLRDGRTPLRLAIDNVSAWMTRGRMEALRKTGYTKDHVDVVRLLKAAGAPLGSAPADAPVPVRVAQPALAPPLIALAGGGGSGGGGVEDAEEAASRTLLTRELVARYQPAAADAWTAPTLADVTALYAAWGGAPKSAFNLARWTGTRELVSEMCGKLKARYTIPAAIAAITNFERKFGAPPVMFVEDVEGVFVPNASDKEEERALCLAFPAGLLDAYREQLEAWDLNRKVARIEKALALGKGRVAALTDALEKLEGVCNAGCDPFPTPAQLGRVEAALVEGDALMPRIEHLIARQEEGYDEEAWPESEFDCLLGLRLCSRLARALRALGAPAAAAEGADDGEPVVSLPPELIAELAPTAAALRGLLRKELTLEDDVVLTLEDQAAIVKAWKAVARAYALSSVPELRARAAWFTSVLQLYLMREAQRGHWEDLGPPALPLQCVGASRLRAGAPSSSATAAPSLPFGALEQQARAAGAAFKPGLSWAPDAVEALRCAAEAYVVALFEGASNLAVEAKRKVVLLCDVQRSRRGRDGEPPRRPLTAAGLEGVTNFALRRLARVGAVKYLAGAAVYEEARNALQALLDHTVRDAVQAAGKRMVVTAADVVGALRHNGIVIYGFA